MTNPITTAIPYFSESELACKGSGIIKLDPRFAEALPKLREAWDAPLSPNSVCRSPEHNTRVGGNPRSLHMTENVAWPTLGTMAADISWASWPVPQRLRFAKLAWSLGWSVGLHNSFCHVDRRIDLALPALPQSVFLYGKWGNHFDQAAVRQD